MPNPTTPPERWSRLRSLLESALELPPADRDAHLAGACADDPALLAEARALLAEDSATDGLAEPPASDLTNALATDEGRRVGPYELRRKVGAGGMGAVYLATRVDGQFTQRVAVKLLRGGDGPDIVARFKRERQVLANLEHPSIARLIDGGIDDRGTPFLAMEFVEGERIDAWADAARLDVSARLELFREVCDAVSHAHRALVVHRDLKPGNILVTSEGRVKLLDFGVAKVLDPEKAASDPEVTVAGLGYFTPAYASPEQVLGRPVTATSDVYSLGVLLFQLLTGRMPYELETTSAAAITTAVCETDAPAPSSIVAEGDADAARALAEARGTSVAGLARRLGGDLDVIVAKALRKEPQRRYASAEQLAGDITRHLGGLPVLARPDTLGYRASRFVARNRGYVAAGALAFGGLAVGLVAAASQYRETQDALRNEQAALARANERAEDLAAANSALDEARAEAERSAAALSEQARDLAEQSALADARLDELQEFATGLVFDIHRQIHGLEGSVEAKKLILDVGMRTLDRLSADAEGDAALTRRLAGGYLRLGEVQGDPNAPNLGDIEAAKATYARALDLAFEAYAADPGPDSAFQAAQACLKVGDMYGTLGELDEAHARFDRGLALEDALLAGEAGARNLYFAFLMRDRQAMDRLRRGDIEGAVASCTIAREHFEAATAKMPGLQRDRYILLTREAEVAAAAGDFEEAAAKERAAVDAFAPAVAAMPQNAVMARMLREARERLARRLAFLGDGAAALSELDAVIAELDVVCGRESGDAQAVRDRIQALVQRANVRLGTDALTTPSGAGGERSTAAAAGSSGPSPAATPPAFAAALVDAERAHDLATDAADLLSGPDRMGVLVALGRSRQAVGRFGSARDALVEARELVRSVAGDVDGNPMLLEQSLSAYRALARIDLDQARTIEVGDPWRVELLEEAASVLRDASAMYAAHEGDLATPLRVGEGIDDDLAEVDELRGN